MDQGSVALNMSKTCMELKELIKANKSETKQRQVG